MLIFEWVVGVLFGAVLLAALARRLGAPYPAFLALGGVGLAFVPGVPNLRLDPELALALFLAPKLIGTTGLSWAGDLGVKEMAQALKVKDLTFERFGDDVLLQALL